MDIKEYSWATLKMYGVYWLDVFTTIAHAEAHAEVLYVKKVIERCERDGGTVDIGEDYETT